MIETKLNATTGRCTNWAQIDWNVERGMTFYAIAHKLKGGRLWVLSGMRDYATAHTDDFYNMLASAQDARKSRYLDAHGSKDEPHDIGYVVSYAGNPIIAVRRNGEILVNERAKSGERQGARAIARLEPLLRSALTANPNLFNV